LTESSSTVSNPDPSQSLLKITGSLWFAVVLLILISVAMACATVYETVYGSSGALASFYQSWWFEGLLGLLAINVASALLVRYPFSRRQTGFVLTHGSILLVLGGALVTQHWGIDGKLAIAEGDSAGQFSIPQDMLILTSASGHGRSAVEFRPPAPQGARSVSFSKPPVVTVGELRAEVERYASDSAVKTEVLDDNPAESFAIEASFSADGKESPEWIAAGRSTQVGEIEVAYRRVASTDELNRLLSTAPATQPASKGTAKIEYEGKTYDFPIESCIAATQPVDDTGLGIRVLRYLPHAMVGQGNQLYNASDKPVNPAIQVELSGKEGTEKRLAFALFPEFGSMHGKAQIPGVKLTFVSTPSTEPTAPVEVLSGPDGALHVRFSHGPMSSSSRLTIGTPVQTPWPERQFAVLRQFEHARVEHPVMPAAPDAEGSIPAVQIRLTVGQDVAELWVQKFNPRTVGLGGSTYTLKYGDKDLPLGFIIKLDRFKIGQYPGTRQPRSFESHVTVTDPAGGGEQNYTISMNNPLRYGSYTLYQSSYRQDRQHSVSILSVSWDPGKPIVFFGYGLMMVGMLWVLIVRLRERGDQTATGPRQL
jgi:hypothetical protein